VITWTVGTPFASNVFASTTAEELHDPQSAMAITTASGSVASISSIRSRGTGLDGDGFLK